MPSNKTVETVTFITNTEETDVLAVLWAQQHRTSEVQRKVVGHHRSSYINSTLVWKFKTCKLVGFTKYINSVDDNSIFQKVDLLNNKLAFMDSPQEGGRPEVRCAKSPSTQTSSSCLILTIHLSISCPEFEPCTSERRKYQQTLRQTPGNSHTSNRLWEPVVTLSEPLLKPKHPLCGCCLWKVPEDLYKPQHSGILQTWQHTKATLSSPSGPHTWTSAEQQMQWSAARSV